MDNLLDSPGGGYILPDGTTVALENVEETCKAFATLLKDDPDGLVACLCDCALEIHEAGLPGLVPEYLDRALAAGGSDEKTAHALLMLGGAFEREKDLGAAALSYGRAMHLPERDRDTWYYLHNNYGYCLGQAGRFEEALPHCLAAIRIDPERHNAFKNLGIALEGLGRKAEAAGCYLKSYVTNMEDERPRQHLADLLFGGDAAQVPNLREQDMMFRLVRGRMVALTEGGDAGDGGTPPPLDDFNAMYGYFMHVYEGRTLCVCLSLGMLAWHRLINGNDPDMSRIMDLVAVAGTRAEAAHALTLLADNLGLAGHGEHAEAVFDRAAVLAPPEDFLLQLRYRNRKGWFLVRSGRPGEAEPYFRKVLEANLWHGDAWQGLGIALLAGGDATGAEQCALMAAALRSSSRRRLPPSGG